MRFLTCTRKRKSGYDRNEFLREASKIPGIYVPSLYTVTYKNDGTIDSFDPIYDDVPKNVKTGSDGSD